MIKRGRMSEIRRVMATVEYVTPDMKCLVQCTTHSYESTACCRPVSLGKLGIDVPPDTKLESSVSHAFD
jgi:hypothetical protein